MYDASTLLTNIQSQNVQIFGYVCLSTNGLSHGPVWKTQPFLSKGICTVILWQDCCGKGNLRKFFWNTVGEKASECLFVHRARGLFLSGYVDDFKLAGTEQKIFNRLVKFCMKDADLGEPTSFLDHVYLGMHSKESVKSVNEIVANYKDMFESRISAGAKEKLPTSASGKPDAETISSWSHDMGRSSKEMCGKILRTCE